MMSFSKGLPFHLLRCYIAILIFIAEWHVGGVRIHTEIQAEGQNTLGLRAKEDGWPPVQPAFMGIQLRAIETLTMLT